MDFAVDIETVPDLSMLDLLPEVKASRVLKDPEKIEKDLNEKKLKQIEEMSVDPIFAKIICICLYNPKNKITLLGDEKDIIQKFWNEVGNGNHGRIFTYNGRGFDIDVILKRGLKYDVGHFVTDCMLFRPKYTGGRVVDLMEVFCKYGEYRKLDTLAEVYLGKTKIEIDYKKFPELLGTPEGELQIAEYCMRDAELTWELAKKFGYDLD